MARQLMTYLLLLYGTGKLTAQKNTTAVWLAAQIPVQLASKWQWHNDAGYRTINGATQPFQYLYRTGVRYFLNKQWSSAAGVAFFRTTTSFEKSNHTFGSEFRLWQEVNYQHHISQRLLLQNRLRTEQRFFAAVANKPSFSALRLRNRLALTHQLTNKLSTTTAYEWMGQWSGGVYTFNQNRLSASFICQAAKGMQWQCGYMWLHMPSAAIHILNFTVTKNIILHAGNNNTEK
jgi:hypothetical protein